MLLEIECNRNTSRQIQVLKKWRFSRVQEESTQEMLLFRRYIHYNDKFVDDCLIDKAGNVLTRNVIGSAKFNTLPYRGCARGGRTYEVEFILTPDGIVLVKELIESGACILRICDDGDPSQFELKEVRLTTQKIHDLVLHMDVNYRFRGM